MPTLENSLRAPAETPLKGVFSMLERLIEAVLWPIVGCRHHRASLPYNNHQTCLDCGATRYCKMSFDFEHADAGIESGPWQKPVAIPAYSVNRRSDRAVASQIMAEMAQSMPEPGTAAILPDGAFCPPLHRCGSGLSLTQITETTNRIIDRHMARNGSHECPDCGGEYWDFSCPACGPPPDRAVRQ